MFQSDWQLPGVFVHNVYPTAGANEFVALLVWIPIPKPTVTAAAAGSLTIYALLFGSFAVGATLYWLRRWIPANWPLAGIAAAICAGVSLIGGQRPSWRS